MLVSLSVHNFIIIDQVSLEFKAGLNIFTGETGVGKSLVIEAIEFLLGKRGSADIIRKGAEEAVIEGLFLDKTGQADTALEKLGIKTCPDQTIAIRRIISKTSWKNRIFINDLAVNLSTVSGMSHMFMEIHSQANHFAFLNDENSIHILDRFAGLYNDLEKYRQAYNNLLTRSGELNEIRKKESERVERLDYLRFVFNEINNANLYPAEEDDLKKEYKILANAQTLIEKSEQIYSMLYSNDESIIDSLYDMEKEMEEIRQIDDSFKDETMLKEATILLSEFGDFMRDYSSSITAAQGSESSMDRQEEIDVKLETIGKLKKHGKTIPDILKKKESVGLEIEQGEGVGARAESLEQLVAESKKNVEEQAKKISQKRYDAATPFSKAVKLKLSELMMPGADFMVKITPVTPGADGMDNLRFHLSPNPGEGFGPLSEIASGGEQSRITLAIKTMLHETDTASVIFDEIDSGIGGEAARAVGKKLKEISKNTQTFCITHLPQIAAFADSHFCVNKETYNGRTVSTVTVMAADERIGELARMLSGETMTRVTLEHAKEMLKTAAT